MRGEYEWEINWMKLYAIKVYGFWMWCAVVDAGNAAEAAMLHFDELHRCRIYQNPGRET